jgi:hypothetical protein
MTHLEDMKALGRMAYLEYAPTAKLAKGAYIAFEGKTVHLNTTPQVAIDKYIEFVRRDGGKLRDLIHGHLFDIGMRRALRDLVKAEIFDACSSNDPKPYTGKKKEKWLADEELLIKNTVAWLKLLNETWEATDGKH